MTPLQRRSCYLIVAPDGCHRTPHIKAMATAICGRWWAMRGGDGDAETIQSRNRRARTVTGTGCEALRLLHYPVGHSGRKRPIPQKGRSVAGVHL
jgi:hypothetical protein